MGVITDYPIVLLLVSLACMWLAERLGVMLARRHGPAESDVRDAFNVVQGATLTLLALIIGFSFSMSISRYDQRKLYEEAEANAIGTEYVRLDLLPPAEASKARALLVDYLAQRIAFYSTRSDAGLRNINARTSKLQAQLWAAVVPPAQEKPDVLSALVVAGMNDVLNSQGYAQASWWNRIPAAAWALMVVIALGCNLLIGFSSRRLTTEPALLFILPVVIAISFMLIADIDSPKGGLIRVAPQNLIALADSLKH
ncbi:MAG TPA: hypothetical protein VFG49_03895 [Dyella sp.]|uniref:bestrophin-like domain n=1 Tax=Dyella sp. TaxID=1869338 RepID=UPI002D7A36BF|nr:hypothetical protein [Dyella sp.]HET6552658.1 hypothetical protein [Dyella sp.]